MLCWLLLHNKVDQPYVYIYPLPPGMPAHPPPITPPRSPQDPGLGSLCYSAAAGCYLYSRYTVSVNIYHSFYQSPCFQHYSNIL